MKHIEFVKKGYQIGGTFTMPRRAAVQLGRDDPCRKTELYSAFNEEKALEGVFSKLLWKLSEYLLTADCVRGAGLPT